MGIDFNPIDVVKQGIDVVDDVKDTVVDTSVNVVTTGVDLTKETAVNAYNFQGRIARIGLEKTLANDGIDHWIDKGKDALKKGKDIAEDGIDKGKDIAEDGIDKGKDVINDGVDKGKEVLKKGKDIVEDGIDKGKDVLKKGKDIAEDGIDKGKKIAKKAKDDIKDKIDKITHPGFSHPPGAQGLSFAETKGACDLAYHAEKEGEVYKIDGKEYKVVDIQKNPKTGFQAVAIKPTDENDNRVIVAFAGTKELKDWKANVGQGVGLPTKQYKEAVEFANKWKSNAKKHDNKLILTGHSLGGGLASYASIKLNVPATAVNSAPLALNHLGLNPLDARRITQYYVPGEALTVFDEANKFNLRPGIAIPVKGKDSILDPRSVGSNHSLKNVAPDVDLPKEVTDGTSSY